MLPRVTRFFSMPSFDLGTVSAVFAFLGLLIVALLGARLAPHESVYFVIQHGTDPRPYDPGLVFPFGSDILGRDRARSSEPGANHLDPPNSSGGRLASRANVPRMKALRQR